MSASKGEPEEIRRRMRVGTPWVRPGSMARAGLPSKPTLTYTVQQAGFNTRVGCFLQEGTAPHPRRWSTNRRACVVRAARFRTQMRSSRTVYSSASGTASIASARPDARAVVSGTIPTPTPASTIRHTPSKLRSRTRSLGRRPIRAARAARKRCSALAPSSPTRTMARIRTRSSRIGLCTKVKVRAHLGQPCKHPGNAGRGKAEIGGV